MMPRYPPTNEGWTWKRWKYMFQIWDLIRRNFWKNFVYFIVNNQKEKKSLLDWNTESLRISFSIKLALSQLFILNSTNLLNH